jgi:fucose 4-O-acetylase-like acetyltransferase
MMLLGVVLHASISYTSLPSWPFRDNPQSPLLNGFVFGVHAFRMPLFFMVAGFFGALLFVRRGASGLVTNRLGRVLVPLVAAWLLLLPFARFGFAFAMDVARPLTMRTVIGSIFQRNLMHLWFLYDLLFLYAAAVLVASAWPRLASWRGGALGRAYQAIGSSPLGPLVWAIPTTATLLLMPRGVLVTVTGLRPDVRALLAYGVFFAFGWALYAHADQLAIWRRRAWPFTIAGALLLIPYLVLIRGGAPWSVRHLLAAMTGALIAWLMTLGITGLAVRYLDRPIPTARYLSDASYWMYLVHLPLVIWVAGLLRGVAIPAVVKAALVLVAVVPVLLISYRYGVRSTVIGAWLNGRRLPREVGS